MAPINLEHRRTHNLLLASKLLNQRETASPFTLVLDSLEQSARPLVRDCIRRAQKSGTKTIFVALETLQTPAGIDIFIPLWQHGPDSLSRKLADSLKQHDANSRFLLIIDSLNLLSQSSTNLPAQLSSYLRPGLSLLAIYHIDVPLHNPVSVYTPSPLSLLRYLATTIIQVHSFPHLLAQKAARERGIAAPSFGLDSGSEGVFVGAGAQGRDGIVLELEFRRKSGRGMREWYFLSHEGRNIAGLPAKLIAAAKAMGGERIVLLEDHPLWTTVEESKDEENVEEGVTFSLGLTERQRQDREGVVLPYFDAQKGGGEGGRILYDIGAEDDFDEEEDEI